MKTFEGWKIFCATLQGMSTGNGLRLEIKCQTICNISRDCVTRVRAWACRLSTSVADQD
jgi:hypothetical protein